MIDTTSERRGMWRRLYILVWESDTTPTKLSLVIAASITAVGFWQDAGNCTYVACQYLALVLPWWAWAAIWTSYAAVKAWRIIDGTSRPNVALAINILGAFLFGGTAFSVTLARWPFIVLSSFSIAMALAATWVLARTAVNPGYGFKGD